jgi:hypothetical protein
MAHPPPKLFTLFSAAGPLTLAESALTKNVPVTPLQSAVTKKPGGPQPVLFPLRPKQIRDIQVVPLSAFPFWECPCGNGGVTRVKALGR